MQEKKSYMDKAVLIVVIIILVAVIGNKVYSDIKDRELADQFVEEIVNETETLVREAGIPDFEIKVKDKQDEAYAKEFLFPLSDKEWPCYYYHLDLYSDDIADIYRTKIDKQEEEELIDMMDEIYEYANECSEYKAYGVAYVELKKDNGFVYFKHGYPKGSVFIETSSGDRYGYTVDDYYKKRLYINDEMVYERLEEPIEIPKKPEYEYVAPAPSTNTNNNYEYVAPAPSTNTDNNYEYTGEYYDPYGVEDYDNADDFADEWAEEFGDGDYDDGYDDAYDYWEEEY